MIKLHEGMIPFYLAKSVEEIEASKRLFYVGVTRARRLLMYITDTSDRRNRPTRFLGPTGVAVTAERAPITCRNIATKGKSMVNVQPCGPW